MKETMDKIINEAILYGSLYEALENKLFKCQELINYIAENHKYIPRNKLISSIAILLNFYPSTYLYYNNDHLISLLPNDNLIYFIFLLKGGSTEIPIKKDNENGDLLWLYLFDVLTIMNMDKNNSELIKAKLISNIYPKNEEINIQSFEPWVINCLYDCRCIDVIDIYHTELQVIEVNHTNNIIRTDWFDKYNSVVVTFDKFINRCLFLKEYANNYLNGMMNLFEEHMKLYDIRTVEIFTKEQLINAYKVFPQLYSKYLISAPNEYYRIGLYPLPVRAYLLGFNIENNIPSSDIIDMEYNRLIEKGIDEYCKINIVKNEENIINPEDTLCEDPHEYHNFDRYDFIENNKIYRFTRPEFERLLEDNRNFWNKCILPNHVIYTLKCRKMIAELYNLPEADTRKNLLEKSMTSKLYQISEQKMKEETEVMDRMYRSTQYFNLLTQILSM
jgi:hypothetical protein